LSPNGVSTYWGLEFSNKKNSASRRHTYLCIQATEDSCRTIGSLSGRIARSLTNGHSATEPLINHDLFKDEKSSRTSYSGIGGAYVKAGITEMSIPLTEQNYSSEMQCVSYYDSALLSQALTLLVRIGRILAQDKLLYQGIGESAPGVDERTGENQSWPAIARRIVEVCKGARDQIAANA
jgi:hypothetical protein